MRYVLALAQRLLAGVVLIVSGAYLLIYLYRWEWNRAIVSGIFFLAAEVALATAMILRRLKALEQRADSPRQPSPQVLERLRSTPVDRPDPFAWLKTHDSRLGVFVPVLLGAGAILSALAYVVERIGEATALPTLDKHLATRLSVLAPPPGGLLGTAPATTDRRTKRSTAASITATVLAVAGIAIVGWLGLGALIDATQSRPDSSDRPVRTTIELSIAQRGAAATSETAEALWVACRPTVGSRPTTGKVIALGDDRFHLVLEPVIGRLSARRLTGCLSDLTLDYVRAGVVGVEDTQRD